MLKQVLHINNVASCANDANLKTPNVRPIMMPLGALRFNQNQRTDVNFGRLLRKQTSSNSATANFIRRTSLTQFWGE